MEREKTLVIGAGEIGKSLAEVLSTFYEVHIRDTQTNQAGLLDLYDVIHIAFPHYPGHGELFLKNVRGYAEQYRAKLTIIHSTVPVGTTAQLGAGFVHSPVNGKHPNLVPSIRTFVKFVGGNDTVSTYKAAHFLSKAGMNCHVLSSSRATELGKLGCTRRYGLSIIEMKEFAKECDKHGVPFHEAYTQWNNEYNSGYQKMHMEQFYRPILAPMEGSIGGHCVIPNLNLLPGEVSDFIKERNDSYTRPEQPKEVPHGKGRKRNGGEKPAFLLNRGSNPDR
jgi:hypothetical protein